GVGGALSFGQLTGTPAAPQLGTLQTDGLNPFFRFAAPATATADNTTVFAGQRWRATAQGYYYVWRIGGLGEYVWNRQDVRIGPNHPGVTFQAWQGYVTLLLTDDRASYSGVRPKRPFNLESGGTGAWEIGFRYSGISVSDEAFAAWTDPAS